MISKVNLILVAKALFSLSSLAITDSGGYEISNFELHTEQTNSSDKTIPNLPYMTGVTLSGMDFPAHAGNKTNKNSSSDSFTLPSFDQAIHYLGDRHVNLIKLPIAWESLQSSTSNDALNRTALEIYTDVVATVLSKNASVILTLSTSAERFAALSHGHKENSTKTSDPTLDSKDNSPTDDATHAAFIQLWGRLAKRFKAHRRVIFHLMEFPQDSVPSKNWNNTVQAVVTEIRNNSAKNVIILPSSAPPQDTSTFNTFRDFSKDFQKMKGVRNPDGTTHGIVFDLSLTLGPKRTSSPRCGGVNATAIIKPVVTLLREHNRQAIVGTLAAPSEASCVHSLGGIAKNISLAYPYLAGFVMYGAGAYPEDRPWSLIKEGKFGDTQCSEEWIDQPNFGSVLPFLSKRTGAPVSTPQN